MNKTLIITLSLISSTCFAEQLPPLSLPPIGKTLDCGVVIEKNIGTNGDLPLKDYNMLNRLCSDVVSNYKKKFPEFILPEKIDVPVSFMARNTLVANFGHRVAGEHTVVYLDGFTEINSFGKPEHFYVLSDYKTVKYFKIVFAHELFHVLNALSNHEDSEKEAAEFTVGIGLGI
jgi:hypothetical protein